MATRPNKEFNYLLKMKRRMAGISEDIRFLKLCIKYDVTPKSHEIKLSKGLPNAQGQKRQMERGLMKKSISFLHCRLNITTLGAYSAHLALAKQLGNQEQLYRTLEKIQRGHECEKLKKRKTHNKKLRNLRNGMNQGTRKRKITMEKRPETQMIPDFVVNKSKEEFTDKQLRLLNKGLNFAIRMPKPPTEEIAADVEAAIKFNPLAEQAFVRAQTAEAIQVTSNPTNARSRTHFKQVKELNKKPVYFLKADKGNKIVIMDRDDYDKQVFDKLRNGPYKELKMNPLPDSLKRIDRVLRNCEDVLGDNARRIRVPNPSLPRIKCLPKIHKPGNEMREIIAANNAPTQKLAAWLLSEFKSMDQGVPKEHTVKNYSQVVERIQQAGEIGRDECMVSFDIKALFPSIPIQETLGILEDWLMTLNNANGWKYKVRQYVQLTKICMTENQFMFRGKYFKSTAGVAMGNPLSGFLSEIFLGKMEENLQAEGLLPRLWIRYVDDIFAILDNDEIEETLRELNKRHKMIQFTMEVEEAGRLPFLDLLVKRDGCKLEFEIYRKPTNTQRFIPNCSNHPTQHKLAAFNSMAHRLVGVPMSEADFEKEKDYILDTAEKNGYQRSTILSRIRKIKNEKRRDQLTTLYQQDNCEQQSTRRTAVTFDNGTMGKIRATLKKVGIEAAPTSRAFQLKTLLKSTKDKKNLNEKSGIYCINCPHCNKKYIGQTKRLVTTRFDEHIREANTAEKRGNKQHNFKSTVAKHIASEGHIISREDLTVIKEVNDVRKLDFFESLMIRRENPEMVMNEDKGCCDTPLFEML